MPSTSLVSLALAIMVIAVWGPSLFNFSVPLLGVVRKGGGEPFTRHVRLAMQIIGTVLTFAIAGYVLLSREYSVEEKGWAGTAFSGAVGFWFGKA